MRIALGLSYDGAAFSGWQTQPQGTGVQDAVEQAIRAFTNGPAASWCAGRTDAGVHACAQVIHVDTLADRDVASWVRGLNALLPRAVNVQWAQPVSTQFNARFAALSREYTYVLLTHPVRPTHLRQLCGWSFRRLDAALMQAAAQCLVGSHDFSAFRSAQCQAASPIRTIESINVLQRGNLLITHIQGNAFLHHMVRNIMGSLVQVGQGKWPPQKMAAVLASRDRRTNARTFEAAGLYLTAVNYPPQFGLPIGCACPPWWQL